MNVTIPPGRQSAIALTALVLVAACATGSSQTTSDRMPMASSAMSDRNALLAQYPDKQRQTATEMMAKYGQPDVMSNQTIAWFNKGGFVKTVIRRDGVALNLAHDVAMSRRTPADARAFYARTAMAFKGGDRSSPYVNGLIFQQELNAADPDRPAM